MSSLFRHIIIAGLIFGAMTSAVGQKKPKYEDVLPDILKSEPVSAIATLKNYKFEETTNASPHLQLALIYYKRFQESDPIKGYNRAMANMKLAQESFKMATHFLDPKVVKKDKEEYINFATYDERGKYVVPFDSITNTIARAEAEMATFEANVPGIYEEFTASFREYDKANKLFTEIVGKYKNLKELYLLYNSDVSKQFDLLKSTYEKSLSHFKTYEEKKATYDIGYSQKLVIEKINTYRIDGLAVEISFLDDDIIMWDFSQWVDDVREHINTEIADLRAQMIQHEKLIDERLKRTTVDYENNEFEGLKVDKEFLFTLRKYDLNSVIEPIFLFKEYKHLIMHNELAAEALDTSSLATVDRKLFIYGQMLNSLRHADTVLHEIKNRNTDLSYAKYRDFIDVYYTSMGGIDDYANVELDINHSHFQNYLEHVRKYTAEKFAEDTAVIEIKYKRLSIPGVIAKVPDSLEAGQYITTHIEKNLDGSRYVGGVFQHTKENRMATFLLRQESDGSVRWLKELLISIDGEAPDSQSRLAILKPSQSGVTLIVNASHDSIDAKMNTMFSYDEEGSEVLVKNLDVDDYPRSMNYVERTNSYVVTFLDKEYEHDFTKSAVLTISDLNVKGETIWEDHQKITGDVNGMVITDTDFLVNGNYAEIELLDGTIERAPEGGSFSYVIQIGYDGEIRDQLLFKASQPYHSTTFFKAGDRCINIFGTKNPDISDHHLDLNPATMVHFVLNKNLQVLSSNLE